MLAWTHCCCFFSSVLLACGVLVHGQSLQEGFLSIDCGIPDGSGYQNPTSKIGFVADTSYVDSGENKNVSSGVEGLAPEYGDVRSFPNGSRNCYTLRPVKPRGKYLIRASFVYGNYDGKNSTPEFDLHVGVNFWTTVRRDGTKEIITVAPADYIWVCLVNMGKGTPFISSLELRPLRDTMYVLANPSQSLVLIGDRRNYGATSQLSSCPSRVGRWTSTEERREALETSPCCTPITAHPTCRQMLRTTTAPSLGQVAPTTSPSSLRLPRPVLP